MQKYFLLFMLLFVIMPIANASTLNTSKSIAAQKEISVVPSFFYKIQTTVESFFKTNKKNSSEKTHANNIPIITAVAVGIVIFVLSSFSNYFMFFAGLLGVILSFIIVDLGVGGWVLYAISFALMIVGFVYIIDVLAI